MLPDGIVVVLGGTIYARLLSGLDPVLVPEMFDPATKTSTRYCFSLYVGEHDGNVLADYSHAPILFLATTTSPRSFSTIRQCGLCNGCSVKHFGGQVFSPPYLLQAGGITPASRPAVASTMRVPFQVTLASCCQGTGCCSLLTAMVWQVMRRRFMSAAVVVRV